MSGNDAHKQTRAWGEAQAASLWRGTLARFRLPWRGATTLDFGCHWGYLCKLLVEEQGVKAAYGVDLHPLWEGVEGWRPNDTPGVHLFSGDIRAIPELSDVQFDIVTTAGTLMLIPPSDVKSILEWIYDHLRPGGHAVIRTRTFLSWCGGDLHRILKTPLPHLLFARREVDAYLASRGLPASRYMSPLCGASYLTLYHRVGFEIRDVSRITNRIDDAVLEQFRDKLGLFDEQELRTSEVLALLRRPEKALDLTVLEEVCAAG